MLGQTDELRDPTLEELYTGPARALPDEIQQLPAEDTACTFCGVSYFVFAEVQALQATVKQYKSTFREFVQFMEHERSVAKDLRQQITHMKGDFAVLVTTCAASAKQFAEQNEAQRSAKQEALEQLQRVQRECLDVKDAHRELQMQSKRDEDEQKSAHSLVEQNLRNEILQLSGQVESFKVESESQMVAFKEGQDRDQQRIRELEVKFVEDQTHWKEAESQLVAARDGLEQQIQELNARVEKETRTAQQVQEQLSAVREELASATATTETQQKSNSNMNSEIIQLKHQLQTLEKSRAQLLSENGRYKDGKYKFEDEINALRLRVDQLQGQLSVSTAFTGKVKADHDRDLEKLRKEQEEEVDCLRQDHLRAIEGLNASHNSYLDGLKKENAELQMRGEQSSRLVVLAIEERLRDAERRANEWKDRALQNASEREEAIRHISRFESMVQALQAQLDASEHDKKEMIAEAESTRIALEKRLKSVQLEAQLEGDNIRQAEEQRQKSLQKENVGLQRQLSSLQEQLEHLRVQLAKAPQHQVARQPKPNGNITASPESASNQDCHDNDRIINQLRGTLKLKDREISLLQQTVHRECMERTSLLERMRSGNFLPDIEATSTAAPSSIGRSMMKSHAPSCSEYADDNIEHFEHTTNDGQQPKASFYENLRKAGTRKPKPRK